MISQNCLVEYYHAVIFHKILEIDLQNYFKQNKCQIGVKKLSLSGHVPEIQAEVEVVKIKNPDFSVLLA